MRTNDGYVEHVSLRISTALPLLTFSITVPHSDDINYSGGKEAELNLSDVLKSDKLELVKRPGNRRRQHESRFKIVFSVSRNLQSFQKCITENEPDSSLVIQREATSISLPYRRGD